MRTNGNRRILIVGSGALARATVADLRARGGCDLLGFLKLDGEDTHPALGAPGLGGSSRLSEILLHQSVDEVYLAASVFHHHLELQRAITACESLGIGFAVPAHVFRLNRSHPSRPGLGADGYIHYRSNAPKPVQEAFKRSLDIAGSLAALLLLAPLMLVIAMLIKLDSRGPVFFRQLRVGRNGRLFTMLKLRSMVVDAEKQQTHLLSTNEQDGPVFKIRRDPRITRVGRFIRRYSIDELPQFWNVLVGDMSLVGPRPPILQEVEQYEPWQYRRLSVRPGLTCFWQVSGRNEIGFDEWMRLDLTYVDQWSLTTDLRLLGRTLPAVLSGSGAS